MKLRIMGNTIRMRLSNTEVKELKVTGEMSEFLTFPGGETLTYSLAVGDRFTALFHDGNIRISLPESLLNTWADSNELTIDKTLELPEGDQLKVLVEKDLAP